MMKSSEGVRRLSLFAGSICAFLSVLRSAWVTDFFTNFDLPYPFQPIDAIIHIGLAVFCFLIPWALVHGVAWVIRGFAKK